MSGSFVNHGGLGKTFPAINPTPNIWSEAKLRQELQERGVWPSSLPGNVEGWYPRILPHVQDGQFTFEEFAEEFASNQRFDFGETLRRLLKQPPLLSGGWLEGMMD